MFTYLASEAVSTEQSVSGIATLGINGGALIVQLLTFLFVFFVLRRFAFGPILKMLETRRATIESGVQLGEDMKIEKAQFEKAVARQLSDARIRADAIIADADANAKDTVRSAEEKAQAKAAIIIDEGKLRGEQEVTRARKKMESELAGLVAEATEAIIGEKVDATKDAQLIDRALKGAKA